MKILTKVCPGIIKYFLLMICLHLSAQQTSNITDTLIPLTIQGLENYDLEKKVRYYKKDCLEKSPSAFIDFLGRLVQTRSVTPAGQNHVLLSKENGQWNTKEVRTSNPFGQRSAAKKEVRKLYRNTHESPSITNNTQQGMTLSSNAIQLSNLHDGTKVQLYDNRQEFTLWNLITLCIIAQGFFLLVLLLFQKAPRKSNVLLGLFIMCFLLLLTFWIGHRTNRFLRHPDFYFLYYSLPILLGPILLFYVKSITGTDTLKSTLLHLLPFLFLTLYFVPFYALSYEEKTDMMTLGSLNEVLYRWDVMVHLISAIHLCSFFLYTFWVFRQMNSRSMEKVFSERPNVVRVVRITFFSFALLSASALFNYISIKVFDTPVILDFLGGILMVFMIYFLGYVLVNGKPVANVIETKMLQKYGQSSLRIENVTLLTDQMINYIEQEQPYLQFDYKLTHLSEQLNIPAHHISEILNVHCKKNFSELINGYRIEEAKRLLQNNSVQKMKIDAIAYDVGFNSRTTFYFWFKRITGITPLEYQKGMDK